MGSHIEITILGKQVAIKGEKNKKEEEKKPQPHKPQHFHLHINQIIQHQAMSSIYPFNESILWPAESIVCCF